MTDFDVKPADYSDAGNANVSESSIRVSLGGPLTGSPSRNTDGIADAFKPPKI